MARVLVIAVLACGGTQHPAPKPTVVTVQNAGAEPRRLLRFGLPQEAVEQFEMDVKTRTTAAMTNTVLETGRGLIDLPTVRVVGQYSIRDGKVTESIADATALEDVIDPTVRKSLRPVLRAYKRMSASWRQSPSGARSEITVQPTRSAELATAATQSLEATAVVFPDTPLGLGATWTQQAQIDLGGVRFDRTATYQLTALDDTKATVSITAHTTAPSQTLSVDPNNTYELTHATRDEVGEIKIAFDRIVATETLHVTSDISLSIVRRQLRLSSTVQSDTTMTVQPR